MLMCFSCFPFSFLSQILQFLFSKHVFAHFPCVAGPCLRYFSFLAVRVSSCLRERECVVVCSCTLPVKMITNLIPEQFLYVMST